VTAPSQDTPTQSRPESVSDRLGRAFRRGNVRIGAIIAIAIAVGFIVWAAIGIGGDDDSTTAAGAEPVAVSRGGLSTLAGALGQPIYWVGPRGGGLYELQQLPDGKAYVRYLPSGVEAGASQPLLTVGTYPLVDAYGVTQSHARAQGSIPVDPKNGGVGFTSAANATSVYVAFPGSDFQIEVFHPTPARAQKIVERGTVERVPANAVASARAATPEDLNELSSSLGQPIYWAGPEPNTTYEATESAGSVYVRYLPEGVKVGDAQPQTTVATYPLANAFAKTRAVGRQPGMELVKLPGGGVAAFEQGSDVTHGYVAYPQVQFQVEVFDPMPGAARELVEAGRIAPVS
jgi:hypothetical protein